MSRANVDGHVHRELWFGVVGEQQELDAIVEDITANLNADPRISTEEILVTEADKGIAIQATITYVPLNITEKLRFDFDENSLLRLS